MSYLAIFHLILYNFLQTHTKHAAIFHCWQPKVLPTLFGMLGDNSFYTQYINLAQASAYDRFQYRHLTFEQQTKLAVFLDMNCAGSEHVMNVTSQYRLYNHRYHWLLYDGKSNLSYLQRNFQHANLSIDADVTYVMPKGNDQHASNDMVLTLYDVYNKGSHIGGKLNVTIDQELRCDASGCRFFRYLSELHTRSRLEQRKDLSELTFRIATIVSARSLDEPKQQLLDFLSSKENAHIDWVPRFSFHLLLIHQDILRFNMSHIWSNFWSENDYIGGVIGEIVNETAEIANSPFVYSPGRARYVSPVTDVSSFRSVCIFRTPHNAGIKLNAFLEPFDANVWTVFACLLLITGLFLWLTFYMEHQRLRNYLTYMPSVLTTCLISFGAACIQGSNLTPRSIGGRMAFLVLMATSFLMYNFYTSIVVSTLLGSPVKSNIKTVQQLADSSLDIGFEPIPFTKVYLDSSPRADIRSLVKQKVETKKDPSSVWLSPQAGVLKVRDVPGFVFVSEASFMYYYVEKYYKPHEICELNEILFRPESTLYSLMHRNSTYKELIKLNEVRMLENGVHWKHRNFWVRKKLHCYNTNYVINVGIEYAAPLFIMLAAAYILVLLLLGAEFLWKYYVKNRRRRTVHAD